jgi:eukaryotic-like serine/threonine-protein kinase
MGFPTRDPTMADGVSASSETPAVIAETYRLLERLGGGGMGEVYAAEHLRTGRQVALKLLRGHLGGDVRALRRFEREARALAAIHSEHVVSILDCGALESGAPYLVMERLLGEDLRRLLDRSGRLPLRRALHLAIDVCRGLRAVHASGLVHRDLKPANLFLTRRDNGEELCKILDFGVAKVDTSAATHQGTVIGTVRYMAPEQLTDGANVGPRGDIYAVGAILYECVTGVPPHAAETVQELMFNIVNRDVEPATKLVSELPLELDRIFERALTRDPERRFPSADSLATALEALLPGGGYLRNELEQTGTYDLPPRAARDEPSRFMRLSRSTALATSLGLVVGSFGGGWWLSRAAAPSPETSKPIANDVGKPQPPMLKATAAVDMATGREPKREASPSLEAAPVAQPTNTPARGGDARRAVGARTRAPVANDPPSPTKRDPSASAPVTGPNATAVSADNDRTPAPSPEPATPSRSRGPIVASGKDGSMDEAFYSERE